MRLNHKVAIVTGAVSGIGRATTLRFAAEGAHVMAIDINGAGVEETVRMIPSGSTGRGESICADVSQAA